MGSRISNFVKRLVYSVPSEYASDFKIDCLEKNVRRFSVLPFFNIITQIACVFIYLYVYPAVYPERKPIDAKVFLAYSAVYCVVNLVSAILFVCLRSPSRFHSRLSLASGAVYTYIMFYVVSEAAQVAIELEISGNIYRFLATFFVVSFFPLVGRGARFAYMFSYIVISELALSYLQASGVNVYSYPEINIVVFLVCLIASNVYYNSVVRNFELRKKLEFLSMNDELTGLSNRRSLNQYLKQCWNTAIRNDGSIGVLMIDIDYFKRFNDTYGHQAGDNCLADVASAIRSCFDRTTDLCARYGGEEFVVVIAHIPPEGALLMAERVRTAVSSLRVPHSGNPVSGIVTCSIGMTVEHPVVGESPELLLRHADDALYEAKASGRNAIRVYSPAETSPSV
ncbi:GGDEF domain-containing protein [Oscillospiraceae bacterium OttesenSCG-928-G22]|nr:GGDEF domain-containing protein [Oscillospiraceae bacterium OttesenSCG-928-G22]